MQKKEFQSGKMQSNASMKSGHLIKIKSETVILGGIMSSKLMKSLQCYIQCYFGLHIPPSLKSSMCAISILSLHSVMLFCIFLSKSEKMYVNNYFNKNCVKIINIFHKISHL